MPVETFETLEAEEKKLVEENKTMAGLIKALTQGQCYCSIPMNIRGVIHKLTI